jgi:catechol 2,3-dioxygenase-like lactoylglutathione lyase family enzyme
MSIALRTVGIIVKEMPKTLAFYRMLGLNIPQDADTEENVDFEAENGIVLGFVTEARVAQNDPNFGSPTSSSLNLQFECGSPAEVDETFARMTAAGYAGYAEPWDTFWGQRFGRVTDPDNRIVNLYAPLATEQN